MIARCLRCEDALDDGETVLCSDCRLAVLRDRADEVLDDETDLALDDGL